MTDPAGKVATVPEAVAAAEVVVVAVPWGGAEDAVRAAGGGRPSCWSPTT